MPELDLAVNGLTAAGLQAIFARPRSAEFVRLEELHLGSNTLDDAGAAALADCPHLANVAALSVPNCNIGDDGVRKLANSPHLNRVALLDLSNNPISDSGFRALHNSPHWRGLRRLVYSPAGVSTGMRAALDAKYNRPPRRA